MSEPAKNKDPKSLLTLADIEREVVAEYLELSHQQLERRLQALADHTGDPPPCDKANTGR